MNTRHFLLASVSSLTLLSTGQAQNSNDGSPVFSKRPIPADVQITGHGFEGPAWEKASDAQKAKKRVYGYRIPSLLTSTKGTTLAFAERRVGLHDHAQNDIVVKRSADGGKTWGPEIVVFEDGKNSINDPLSVQLDDGRIMLMFARFPYGRHSLASGWIKMADPGYDDPTVNILTYVTYSSDDGKTWTKPVDITKAVKPAHWLNANTPGAMIQLKKGPHKGRIVTPLWGTVPVKIDGKVTRSWEIANTWSDDGGKTWKRTEPLKDPEKGFPNECQIVEASNGDLVIISRNKSGERFRKKAISSDGGETWTAIATDKTLPSVACMGSVIKGPLKADGSWDLIASFPSSKGRVNGQLAVSKDHGKTWEIKKVINGQYAYSAIQLSADQKKLHILYENQGYKTISFLSIPLSDLK